jgi:hypothetical protein
MEDSRRTMRPRSSIAATSMAIGLLMVTLAPVAAQQGLVSLERASVLKATYPFVRFSTLGSFDVPQAEGFTHGAPASTARSDATLALPEEVVALHGKAVSIRGFMLPIDVNAAGVKTFILTSSIDSCHWGMIGLPTEWVLVEMADNRRVPFLKFQPVTVFGRMSVEPSYRGGRLSGLYQIRGEYMSGDGL